MATGFHGFHVLIGTIFLIVCLIRAMRGHFTPKQHFGFEAAAWYWHFVDVVWLFLFFRGLRLGILGCADLPPLGQSGIHVVWGGGATCRPVFFAEWGSEPR
jgi:hypothetical protein